MKKIMAGASALLLATTLVACGNGGAKTDSSGKKVVKVGIAIYNFADNFMAAYRDELKSQVEKLNDDKTVYKVEIVDGKNNPTDQNNQIETFINQQYDLVFVNLVNTSGGQAVVNKLKSANIPAVFINREPEEAILKSWDRITYVGADAAQSGKIQGEIIAELENKGDKNEDGKIDYFMLQGDPENIDAKLRTEYSISNYEALSKLKADKLNLVRADWDTSKANTATQAELSKTGDKLEVIFSNNDGMATGAIAALKAAGKVPGKDVYVVGVDAIPEALKAVKSGELNGTVLNDHVSQSKKAVEMMQKLLGKEKVDFRNYVDYVKVTSANVDQYLK